MSAEQHIRRALDENGSPQPCVLVVDDSRAIRFLLTRTLNDAGFETSEASDGQIALALCRQNRPSIVLLDVDMPVMDGMETIQAMQADPDLADIPVLFLTARTGADDLVQGLDLGARDYLRKPCQPREIIARVTTTLRLQARENHLREKAQELDQLSATDPLTGLANRRGLMNWVESLQNSLPHRGPAGVALFDLDHFKGVNDTYGHGVGDAVLQITAARLTASVAQDGKVARWGGEEFLTVFPHLSRDALRERAQTLRRKISDSPFDVGWTTPLYITTSGGCASGDLATLPATVDRADKALYLAKRLGRNQIAVDE